MENDQNIPPLSVLICAKNDLPEIQKNLPFWLSQSIDQKEILIIDDFSGIDTEQYIRKCMLEKKGVSYYKVNTNLPGKKQAIKEGLSVASYNYILLTDADCKPSSNNWAKSMISTAINSKKDIVLGYSPYKVNSDSWLNLWIHFEAWMTGILYLSFCLRGQSYMGVGRNLLYNKEIIPSNALKQIDEVVSGDDDLLINVISTANNTTICILPDSFCYTEAKTTWKSYFKQKMRHYSTATYYKKQHQLLLGLFSISQISFFIVLSSSIISGQFIFPFLVFIVRGIIITPIAFKNMRQLKASFSKMHFLFFDIALSFYYLFFGFSFLFPKRKDW